MIEEDLKILYLYFVLLHILKDYLNKKLKN